MACSATSPTALSWRALRLASPSPSAPWRPTPWRASSSHGREPICSRGTTLIVNQVRQRNPSSSLHRDEGLVTTFLVILLHGYHPPVPTCPFIEGLSSVSRSRKGSEKLAPFRTCTIHRIAVGDLSHTMFAQRGSVSLFFLSLRITADWRNVNALALPQTHSLQ